VEPNRVRDESLPNVIGVGQREAKPAIEEARAYGVSMADGQRASGSSDENNAHQGRECPWCSAPVPPDATRCPACGDALAQRESIDDLAIAGVTIVDPVLQAYAAQPLHIPLPMPSGVDPIGGSISLKAMAELAAQAAPANVGAHAPVDPNTVGKASDAALQAVERLDCEDESGLGGDEDSPTP
jgi:hypothetical protein